MGPPLPHPPNHRRPHPHHDNYYSDTYPDDDDNSSFDDDDYDRERKRHHHRREKRRHHHERRRPLPPPPPHPYPFPCSGGVAPPCGCVPPNLGASPCVDADRVQCELDRRRAALDLAQAEADAMRSAAGCQTGPGPSCPVGLWDPVCVLIQNGPNAMPTLKTFSSECEVARFAAQNPNATLVIQSRGRCTNNVVAPIGSGCPVPQGNFY